MEGSIWSMYFCSIVSFQYHPGVRERLSLEDCGRVADLMLVEFRRRYVCPGLVQ